MLYSTHVENQFFLLLQHEEMSVMIFERIYNRIENDYLTIMEDKSKKDVIKFVTNLIKGMKVCNYYHTKFTKITGM